MGYPGEREAIRYARRLALLRVCLSPVQGESAEPNEDELKDGREIVADQLSRMALRAHQRLAEFRKQ